MPAIPKSFDFDKAPPAPKQKQTSAAPVQAAETVEYKCECGKTHRTTLYHYQRRVLPCGVEVWAMRPRRDGPLKAFKHPGENKRNTRDDDDED